MEPPIASRRSFLLAHHHPSLWLDGYEAQSCPRARSPGVTVATISPDPAIGRVRDSYSPGRLLSGCAFQAQLFVKTNISDSDLMPEGSPQCFLEGDWAGCTRPWLFSGYA